MTNDNILTFHGHVGTPVELREGANVPWVLFRVASTPSFWDQASRSWRDLPTTWMSVKAFRQLRPECRRLVAGRRPGRGDRTSAHRDVGDQGGRGA
ncbi:single-stranded DNA-binding protein [Aeromicrobium sp. UC242_57]|uniref:single-stranded DNA-binding protein n=1 Tax=Aeromicrobium sp. UC242_57 TaxID=3374624 RepID=UPI0037A868F0